MSNIFVVYYQQDMEPCFSTLGVYTSYPEAVREAVLSMGHAMVDGLSIELSRGTGGLPVWAISDNYTVWIESHELNKPTDPEKVWPS